MHLSSVRADLKCHKLCLRRALGYLSTTLLFPRFTPTVWTLRQNAYFTLQEPRTCKPLVCKGKTKSTSELVKRGIHSRLTDIRNLGIWDFSVALASVTTKVAHERYNHHNTSTKTPNRGHKIQSYLPDHSIFISVRVEFFVSATWLKIRVCALHYLISLCTIWTLH
jgi:hypothetical protein